MHILFLCEHNYAMSKCNEDDNLTKVGLMSLTCYSNLKKLRNVLCKLSINV